MAGLGAVLAFDISSPWGVGANAVSTTCGALIGFVTDAVESAQCRDSGAQKPGFVTSGR